MPLFPGHDTQSKAILKPNKNNFDCFQPFNIIHKVTISATA